MKTNPDNFIHTAIEVYLAIMLILLLIPGMIYVGIEKLFHKGKGN